MLKPPKPDNEAQRLRKLYETGILDTQPEKYFDEITLLAAEFCEVPIALVTLIDHERQWMKSKFGLETAETSRDVAFCAYTILDDQIMEVKDAHQDQRFAQNPLVLDDPRIRFYAGAPLTTSDGYNLGSLCVIGNEPKELNERQKGILSLLARNVVKGIELHEEIEKRKRAEEELLKAKAKAEHMAKLKGEFLSVMTHELRTPLNAIVGFTNLLATEGPSPEQLSHIKGLVIASETLIGTVNNILDFSKIDEGKLNLAPEDLNLHELLNNQIILHKPAVDNKNIEIRLEFGSNMPEYVRLDALRMTQVLNNLMSNAIKFTSAGTVTLKCEASPISDTHSNLTFSVSDTGTGIAFDRQDAIFESFTQESDSTTKRYGGTGLGLTISRELVSLMGGSLALDSTPGQGSTFYFSIEVPVVSQTTKSQQQPSVTIDFQQAMVLVVDDSDLNLNVIRRFLEKWNVRVVTAADGEQALELTNKYQFKLILMDLHMPILDGYSTTGRLRASTNNTNAQTPILALTASSEEEVKMEILAAGMNGYLSKPFMPQSLLDALSLHLPRA